MEEDSSGKQRKVDTLCVVCSRSTPVSLRRLKVLHTEERGYKCKYCCKRKVGEDGQVLALSWKKVDATCTSCGHVAQVFSGHFQKLLRDNKLYKCRSCASRKVDPRGDLLPRTKDTVTLTCTICNLPFNTSYYLSQTSPKPHRCKQCCHRRVDSRGETLPLAKDVTSVNCVECGDTRNVAWGRYQKLKSRGGKYRCKYCAKRKKDKDGNFTPRSRDNVEAICSTCDDVKKVKYAKLSLLEREGKSYKCPLCARGRKKLIPESKIGDWTVVGEERVHEDGRWYVSCRCKCGTIRDVVNGNLLKGSSLSCGCSSESIPEQEVRDFLLELSLKGSKIIKQDRKVLEGKEIDIYIPTQKLGVEFNGNYWHSTQFSHENRRHFDKRMLAVSKGVKLIQIRSDEWLFKRAIVESLLKAILGKSEHRHFARKLEVKEVPGIQAQEFLQDNHLMGKFRSARHLGLFTPENELVQLFSYQLKSSQGILDCSRICSLRNHSIVGGVSRLLKRALRTHPQVKKVVSFVDLRYADGHSLEKIGFTRIGVTLGWGWTDGTNWFNRLKCKAISEKSITEREHAALKGWHRIYDAGQAKYEREVG